MPKLNWRDVSLHLVWIAPLVSAVYLYLLCLALKPLFNALPALEQRAGVIYASFSVTSALLLLGLPTTDGQRAVPRSLRSTFLCGAAVAASLAAIGNRYVATFATHASPAYITGGKVPYLDELTDVLAPQFAALATLVFLGVGVVVPLLALASPPKPQGDDQKARLARGMAHSLPFVMTYLFEGMMAQFKGRIENPEQGMVIISGIIILLSIIIGLFPGPQPVVAFAPVVEEKAETKGQGSGKATKGKKKAAEKVEEPAAVPTQQSILDAPIHSPVKSMLLRTVPVVLAAIAFNFHPPAPFQQDVTRVLSSVESVSGRVIVADSSTVSAQNETFDLRYLRADHSILGGVWIRKRQTKDGSTVDLGDSVFAAFPLQEIAVLARPEDASGRALVIGLGAGIGAVYYNRRGYDVDVVEFDEAVVQASMDHFGLRRHAPASVNVMDGAAYVRDAADAVRDEEVKEPAQKWDVIVQDVFTAGALPVQLFTVEFWQNIKTILKPDGIVVMNFPGATKSASSQAVVNSLIRSFPNCRVFSDAFTQEKGKNKDMANMVFVCAEKRPEFRKPTAKDTLNSALRERIYSGFLTSEVDVDTIAPPPSMRERLVLRDAGGQYTGWDRQIASDSFKAIDDLLTAAQWRAY